MQFILAQGSRGLRASTAGQHGGGLSICLTGPHLLNWEPYSGGKFRATIGKSLWGEKWQNVLEGGCDADKIEECVTACFCDGCNWQTWQVLLVLKMPRDLMHDKYRLVGRHDVMILPPTVLQQHSDGNHYFDKSNILKVYILTKA